MSEIKNSDYRNEEKIFQINERFITLSGEAPTAGTPMYLIRFSGCNLQCEYCDTKYNTEINENITFAQLCNDISNQIKEYPEIIILFTGGEPLLNNRNDSLEQIANQFPDTKFYIETNGSIIIDKNAPKNLCYVLDWKTPSSGYKDSFCTENLLNMRTGLDVIKFVVNSDDLPFAKEKYNIIKKTNPAIDIYFSPQTGNITLPKLADFILKNKLQAKLSLQIHKIIWGEKRGV